MTPALQLQGVIKRYGRRTALDELDLTIPRGSLFGLVGSNGAGKTTAMAVAVGLLSADGGSVDLLGDGPFHPGRHIGRVSLLPQDSRLPLHAGVEGLLRYYGQLQGLRGQALERSVDEVLHWTHLEDRRRSTVRTLSHGMLRRLTIAQAFLGQPELVLLDEPLSGLDPREQIRIREMLTRRRAGQTLLISSHQLHDLEALCDHVAFVEQGRRIRQDALASLVRTEQAVTLLLDTSASPPLAELEAAVPGAACRYDDARRTLTIAFAPPATVGTVNRAVVPLLLRAGIDLLEIRKGTGLEQEYLKATKNGPA